MAMAKNRALWWRIITAILLAVILGGNVTMWAHHVRQFARSALVRGGHSMVFEIRTPNPEDDAGADLAERMVEILRKRTDPHGRRNLEWRSVGSNRIEVRMPAAPEQVSVRRHAYEDAMEELEAANIPSADFQRFLLGTAEQRAEVLASVTGRQKTTLIAQAEAYDRLKAAQAAFDKARQSGDRDKIAAAAEHRDAARLKSFAANQAYLQARIPIDRFADILGMYPSARDTEGMGAAQKARLEAGFAREVADLMRAHPDHADDIERAVEAYKAWAEVRGPLGEPEDLVRLIRRSGELEFRVLAGAMGVPLSDEQVREYTQRLRAWGPEDSQGDDSPFAWYPIRPGDANNYSGTVRAEYAGRSYMLLSNRDEHKMVHDASARGRWGLEDASRGVDSMGRPAIDFVFDERGARRFFELTSANIDKSLAILLDGELLSAPRIRSAISAGGQITGRFTSAELDENVMLLQAGSLPASIDPEPVSVTVLAPASKDRWMGRVAATGAAMLGAALCALAALVFIFLARPVGCIVCCIAASALAFASWSLMPGLPSVVLTVFAAINAMGLLVTLAPPVIACLNAPARAVADG